MVERERKFADKTENETSYYIGSLANNAEKFSHATRSHWRVENSNYLSKILRAEL
jgi:predicted transposase YbfD/YdcC